MPKSLKVKKTLPTCSTSSLPVFPNKLILLLVHLYSIIKKIEMITVWVMKTKLLTFCNSRLSAFIEKITLIPVNMDSVIYVSISCVLNKIINEITSPLNNKMYSIGVFIDYLSNGSQFVCYYEISSNLLNISCGVQRGSIFRGQITYIV